jgi:signal-transduction protein with cAMP-binding, CBS, and nucleotidyltransferase domain
MGQENLIISEIRKVPFLEDLTYEDVKSLLSLFKPKEYDEGTLICSEGEAGEFLYILLRGEAEVWKRTPDGNKLKFVTIKDNRQNNVAVLKLYFALARLLAFRLKKMDEQVAKKL